MKHLFLTCKVAFAFFFCAQTSITFAQQMPPVPVDTKVRIGKLENGLTYYIRKNNLPEKRADFYIAQKVGAIQEEPSQRGLAHFLEHMCFNGTKHFPGSQLKEYLESIGVKFGENLNAYTSVDETVYNISNVPVHREGPIDSCLLILHDWSNDLLLEEKEIDKERGVIHEEWRTRMSANQRLQEKALPQMFPGSKYADCLPIGNMDVVDNFKYQTLRDYYETWYRPDLQGIVIVGDIDVDQVEAKIKKIFSDIPAPTNAKERVYYPVNNNKEPIVIIEKDKELPNVQLLIFNKHDYTPLEQKNNLGYVVENYAKSLISNMLNARLNELVQTANPPYVFAQSGDEEFFVAKTKDAFTSIVICKENEVEQGLAAALREVERARRFGFTESEYNRAKSEYLRHLESAYNERDKNKNESYVQQYVRHFLDNEPIPGIENEYTILNQIAPAIPVQALNQMMQSLVTDSNLVVALFGPDKEGIKYPEKEQLLDVITKVKAEELTAYVDKVSNEPLVANKPKGGKIVKTQNNSILGTTELTLSNGIKVYLKKTEFKADEILMKGFSLGGSSLFPDTEIANIMNLNDVAAVGGLGKFSTTELEKVLAGKKASASASIGDKTEAINGSCSPKDFETMMQLTYLRFTEPRKDLDAFSSYKTRTKAALQNQELQPMVTLVDSIQQIVYNKHPRKQRLKAANIDQIDYDKILSMYGDRFKDAGDFKFIFVGNIEIDSIKPYIELYLGSLPNLKRKETFKDNKTYFKKGLYKSEFIKEQEAVKASEFVFYNGNCSYNLKNNILMSMTEQILTLLYTEKVREEEGGTYGVYVSGELDKFPKESYNLQIMFDTDPAKKDKLMQIILGEIQQIADKGTTQENLSKVKEFMLKKHTENQKENGYWLGQIDEMLFTGSDMSNEYVNIVNAISNADIQKFASEIFSQNNRVEISMISPEKKK
ncbi:MAG: insulinase family protein [Bacteroides sp.]|jgi:zinc protease|nr:insulinase family protein [Bacteroides sp.]MBP6249428.1 insulinase family protein [Bacteroides sp.]MBP9552627.1 insulinase family protein [Bacteroides sp.]